MDAKERGKFASFIIKDHQILPAVNHYLIVFNIFTVFSCLEKRCSIVEKFGSSFTTW
jgi:hypothetical protein